MPDPEPKPQEPQDRRITDRRSPANLPPSSGLPWPYLAMFLLLALGGQALWVRERAELTRKTIAYSEFKTLLAEQRVEAAEVGDSVVTGQVRALDPNSRFNPTPEEQVLPPFSNEPESGVVAGYDQIESAAVARTPGPEAIDQHGAFAFRTIRVDDPDLVREMEDAGIEFTGDRPNPAMQLVWAWLLPIAAMYFLWRMIARRAGGIGQGVMGFGASKAKLVADKNTGVGFAEVAGCEEAKFELQEVVNFLKTPDRYEALGAKIPKGVLLVGPPGTGKTLLARAVAGEAGVPFFSISGSEFIEMFVGVGAARVRDLFEKAKAQAPCIVFIDELDSIGRQRSVHIGVASDEREQTLNQMLAGMDGFEANVGVVVLAATNRPEVLDLALLRPGRFDRQIVVDAPDLEGRHAILKLHQRGKPVTADVDLRKIAQETPGFSGADLANMMNEAALLAARRGGRMISEVDLEEAVLKVVAGPERRSRRLNENDKHRVAVHEIGHALVAAYAGQMQSVHKISIVPRGQAALGYTLQLPSNDQYLNTRGELLAKIQGLLGGRAAEEVIFTEITTGAENDLAQATALARQMVCVFGMGQSAGLVHCAARRPHFLPTEDGWRRDCSEETAREIDEEVKEILQEAYNATKRTLQDHRGTLERIAEALLAKETLDAKAFQDLLAAPLDDDKAVDVTSPVLSGASAELGLSVVSP